MNPSDNDFPIPRRHITIALCTEYDAHNRPVAITHLAEGVEAIPEQQKDAHTVRVAYESIETEEITFEL